MFWKTKKANVGPDQPANDPQLNELRSRVLTAALKLKESGVLDLSSEELEEISSNPEKYADGVMTVYQSFQGRAMRAIEGAAKILSRRSRSDEARAYSLSSLDLMAISRPTDPMESIQGIFRDEERSIP